jgi:hypothetical protein
VDLLGKDCFRIGVSSMKFLQKGQSWQGVANRESSRGQKSKGFMGFGDSRGEQLFTESAID